MANNKSAMGFLALKDRPTCKSCKHLNEAWEDRFPKEICKLSCKIGEFSTTATGFCNQYLGKLSSPKQYAVVHLKEIHRTHESAVHTFQKDTLDIDIATGQWVLVEISNIEGVITDSDALGKLTPFLAELVGVQ